VERYQARGDPAAQGALDYLADRLEWSDLAIALDPELHEVLRARGRLHVFHVAARFSDVMAENGPERDELLFQGFCKRVLDAVEEGRAVWLVRRIEPEPDLGARVGALQQRLWDLVDARFQLPTHDVPGIEMRGPLKWAAPR